MAQYFAVPLEDIVITDLSAAETENGMLALGNSGSISDSSMEEIKVVSDKIQRMLDGFKVFYEFKREMNEGTNPAADGDIDNFLVFINHMSEYNRMIETSLSPVAIGQQDRDGNLGSSRGLGSMVSVA